MNTTPATGGGPSANNLEDYLLGNKVTGDEAASITQNFIAVQNANTARDTATKIREDPTFATKQQEQAEYAALVSNPLRPRAMKERAGVVEDKAKDREERTLSPHSRRQDREHGRRNTYPRVDRSFSSERERSPRRLSHYDDSPPHCSRYDSLPDSATTMTPRLGTATPMTLHPRSVSLAFRLLDAQEAAVGMDGVLGLLIILIPAERGRTLHLPISIVPHHPVVVPHHHLAIHLPLVPSHNLAPKNVWPV
ncbi:RNA-splicing factor [Ceratobasidium sp. UAMH 11750]|nr:RNA-splicing factor [Ceratobasidium sp. UAMH 11750]